MAGYKYDPQFLKSYNAGEDYYYGLSSEDQGDMYSNAFKSGDIDMDTFLSAQDTGGAFGGVNSFLKDNSAVFGLAGAGLDWWNDSQDRKETKRLNDFKMDTTRQQMAMTQNAYDNNLARSKNGALAGKTSVDSRQYMNPNGQQAQQQGLAAAPAQAPQTPQIPRRTPTRTGL